MLHTLTGMDSAALAAAAALSMQGDPFSLKGLIKYSNNNNNNTKDNLYSSCLRMR